MSGVAPRLCRGKPAFGEVGEVLGLFGKLGKFLVARLREDLPQRGFTVTFELLKRRWMNGATHAATATAWS